MGSVCCGNATATKAKANFKINGRYYGTYRDNACELVILSDTLEFFLIDYDLDAVGGVPIRLDKGVIQLSNKTDKTSSVTLIETTCKNHLTVLIGARLRNIDKIKLNWRQETIDSDNDGFGARWTDPATMNASIAFKICIPQNKGSVCERIEYYRDSTSQQPTCSFTRVDDDLDWRSCDQDTLKSLPHFFQIMRKFYDDWTQ